MELPKLRRSERLRRILMPLLPSPNAVPLSDYPPELMEKVASFLPLEDLRNLRFVNRKINYATVHLFARENLRWVPVDLTFDGLQKLLEISRHYDLSGEVHFGSRIKTIEFRQAVWSDEEVAGSNLALENERSRKQRQIIKEGARNASNLWPSHQDMVANGLY